MIHVVASIETAEGCRDRLLDQFARLVPTVRQETGCIEYGPAVDLSTDLATDGPVREQVVTVLEKWESVDALRDHLAAPHMVQFRKNVRDLVTSLSIRVLRPA